MKREELITEIRQNWKRLYQPDKKGSGIICPLCGSGSGPHGTGITADTRHGKPESLRCWKCGFSGDVIDLIQQETGADFNTALQRAADQLGLYVDPQEAPAPIRPRTTTEAPKPAELADYTGYYEKCQKDLAASPEAISYLQARGISQDTAEKWRLGYDAAWISPTAEKRLTEENNTWRPPTTKRIVIPVSNNYYIARAIDPEVDKAFSKMNETGGGEVEIFNERAISGSGPVFVTEGIFDALAVLEAGEDAIALNSTSNADKLLEKLAGNEDPAPLILCLDNDDAGKRATEKIRAELDRRGNLYAQANICGIFKDPNEALTNDREAFIERVRTEATEIIDAQLQANKGPMQTFLDKIQSESYKPYETGLAFFDKLLGGGILRQTLMLLQAPPGTGKTTLCQQVAEAVAAKGSPVIYLNLEMSAAQMIAKAISGRTWRKNDGGNYSMLEILQGYKWTPEQREEILAEAAAYEREILPNLTYATSGTGADLNKLQKYLDQVADGAKAAGKPAPAVIVDYLHLITSTQRLETQELLKQAVQMLKTYAIKNNTFVLAISATNRASNISGQITLESGRDSSALEYGADYVLSLNYFEVDKNDIKTGDAAAMAKLQQAKWRKMILRVNKSRFTMPGRSAELYFYPAGNTFYDAYGWLPADAERVPFLQDRKADQRKKY